MTYITVKQSPMYRQMTIEELLFGTSHSVVINNNTTNTRTYITENVDKKILESIDVFRLIALLVNFNISTEELRKKDRTDLYTSFYIPKRSGGMRRIDAPNDELMNALRRLKDIFENDFGALYHTSAFAYIKNRCTVDAIKKHQSNESKWFGKYDLSNFFGNTTLDFVMKMLAMIFPFSEVVKYEDGKNALRDALSLAFLNGGLPQGTPISPLITNIMMIPIDHKLANTLRDFNDQRLVYTRYADDFIISSKFNFDHKTVEKFVVDTLSEFEAPFVLNTKKTRYGSSAGSNWNLGVMLNKDNQITVGHKNKRRFQAMLSSYVMDKLNGVQWDKHDVQVLDGLRSYYHSVEGDTIDRIMTHIGDKYNVNISYLIKEDLKLL